MDECTVKCQSMQHASYVFSAMTSSEDDEDRVLNFLQKACPNVCINKDLDGRFAVHIAASLGKAKILNWLLSNQPQINAKDQESGYTPLHRAVFFGQLHAVRCLVDRQANISQIDNDRLTCIDHLMQDRLPPFQAKESNECVEAYVWGPNHNYTLGQKNQRNIPFPEPLDGFRKHNVNISSISMNKFHSVFLGQSGQVFTCGHGQGGRLGHDSEHSIITPTRLKRLKDEICVQAAIGIDHTILLMETGSVWSFGMNQFNQLGHNPPSAQVLAPKCITMFNANSKSIPIKGICTSRFHSIFWNSSSVFTCGLNAGQLGHLKGDNTVVTPKQVTSLRGLSDAEITIVAASDGATAVATSRGDIYLLHEFQCRKIASKQLDIAKIVMIGGNLDSSVVPADCLSDQETIKLQVFLLTTTGKIFIWSTLNSTLTRCFFQASKQIFVKDIALSGSTISLISREGQGFTGKLVSTTNRKIKPAKTSNASNISGWYDFCQREQGYVQIKLQRIPGIHRAIAITCDPEGRNFAAIQVHPSVDLCEVPQILASQMNLDLKQLLLDSDPDDPIHDVVFAVERRSFAAHRFILANHCKTFYKNCCENSNRIVTITGVPADIFQLILEFIYTGTCSLLQDGPCQLKINPTGSSYGVIKSVKECCRKLSVDSLALLLDKVKIKNGIVIVQEKLCCERSPLSPKSREDLCDVSIRSQDGKVFRAHRSILSARLEYFRSMFACGWIETSNDKTVSLAIHSSIVEVILDYIYEDRVLKIDKSDDVEFICNCLSVADQLLISRLVTICESALVRLLTLKNVGELLELACVYNAPQLRASAMQFICLNLAAVVELRSWDCISDEVMEELTCYYRGFHPAMAYRRITPTSTAPSSQVIDSCLAQERSFHRSENEAKRGKTRTRHGQRRHSETKERQISICSNVSTDSNQEVFSPVGDKSKSMDWSTVKKPSKREKLLSTKATASQDQNVPTSPTVVERDEDRSPVKIFPHQSPANLEIETVPSGPQNQPTLYESATIIQTTPVSLKSKKFPKLTQKQRRINSTRCDSTSASQDEIKSPPKEPPPPQNVWNLMNGNGQSTVQDLAASIVHEVKTPLRSIIASEEQQNRNYVTVRSKPLKITQMEEAAMTDLRRFYQVDEVHDEYIIVDRVLSGLIATPIWRSPQK